MTERVAQGLEVLIPHGQRFVLASGTPGPFPLVRDDVKSREFRRLFSVKANMQVVTCVGALEADAILAAEGDPDIVGISVRPLRINSPLRNKPHYTFDLAVRHRDGRETLYEAAPLSQLKPSLDGRLEPPHWNAVQGWCARNGYTAKFVTNVLLEPWKYRIYNARLLLPHVRRFLEHPVESLQAELLSIIDAHEDRTYRQIEPEFAADVRPGLLPAIAALLHGGRCTANLDIREFNAHTPIRRTVSMNEEVPKG